MMQNSLTFVWKRACYYLTHVIPKLDIKSDIILLQWWKEHLGLFHYLSFINNSIMHQKAIGVDTFRCVN